MEEDTEVLDWGNEDDEQQQGGHLQQRHTEGQEATWREDDAEDAVSLGDEDEVQDLGSYQSADQDGLQRVKPPTPKLPLISQPQQPSTPQHHHTRHENYREHNGGAQKQSSHPPQASLSPNPMRTSQPKLVHALPPKPVLTAPVYVQPTPVQLSTLAGPMVRRERRVNGTAQLGSNDPDALPPDWEVRYPRTGGSEAYYYNTKTQKSTWTHPGLVNGESSPSRDRENGSVHILEGRSPAPDDLDHIVQADSLERGYGGRKDAKRRSSPASLLSYEDRHYRPGDTAATTEPSIRRPQHDSAPFPDPPFPPRSQSPRAAGGRFRSRSLTPPRRDVPAQDRLDRTRRARTPPRAPIDHGTWRETERDVPSAGRVGGPLERSWGAPRNLALQEPTQSSDVRARGRAPRMDVNPPSQFAPAYKAHNSRNVPDEWSAPRHRSPPPRGRVPSPPGPRRPQGLGLGSSAPPASFGELQRPTQYGVSSNFPPPTTVRGPSRYSTDAGPAGPVPQRRGRDHEGPDDSSEYEAKRRRVDDMMDLSPDFRAHEDMVATHGLPQRPSASSFPSPGPLGDQSRLRKRQPLPPQSARFAEARKGPGSTDAVPPTSPTISSQDGSPFPPAPQMLLDEGPSPRYANHSTSDIPSAPRRQPPGPPGHDGEYATGPRMPPTRPAGPAGRPSRFDKPLPPGRDLDRSAVEVDPSRMASLRAQDTSGRVRSGMYADRMASDVQVDAPPRGPRAMAGKGNMLGIYPPPPPSPQLSPTMPYPAARAGPVQESLPIPGKLRGHPLQPHSTDSWAERRDRQDPPAHFAKGPHASSDFRRPDDPQREGHLRRMDARPRDPELRQFPQDTRDQRDAPRFSRQPDGPAGPRSFSVSGLNKRASFDTPAESAPARGADRWRAPPPTVNESIRGRSSLNGPDDEYARPGASYPSVNSSPSNRFRPSATDSSLGPRRSFSGNHNDAVTFERPSPPDTYQGGPAPTRPRKNSVFEDQPPRTSRFGPVEHTQSQPPSPMDSEPRIWITREQSLENTARPGVQPDTSQWPPSSSRPPNRPPRSEPNSWKFHDDHGANGLPRRPIDNVLPPAPRHDISSRPPVDDNSGRTSWQDMSSRSHERINADLRPRTSESRAAGPYDQRNQRFPPTDAPPSSVPLRRERDVYAEPHPLRPDFRDSHDQPPPFREEAPAPWGRAGPQASPSTPTSTKVHSERVHLMEPKTTPPLEDVPVTMRTSKPVRIRRPPPISKMPQATPMAMDEMDHQAPQDEHSTIVSDAPPEQGPSRPSNTRRGGSLLDRLSVDTHNDGPSPSLRDRVEFPARADEEAGDVSSDMMDVDFEGEPGARMGKGGKRRFVKAKRGRRGAGF